MILLVLKCHFHVLDICYPSDLKLFWVGKMPSAKYGIVHVGYAGTDLTRTYISCNPREFDIGHCPIKFKVTA